MYSFLASLSHMNIDHATLARFCWEGGGGILIFFHNLACHSYKTVDLAYLQSRDGGARRVDYVTFPSRSRNEWQKVPMRAVRARLCGPPHLSLLPCHS